MQTKHQSRGYKPLLQTLNTMAEDLSGLQIRESPLSEEPCLKVHLHIKTKEAYRKWVCDKGSILYHTDGLKIYARTIDYRSITLKYHLL